MVITTLQSGLRPKFKFLRPKMVSSTLHNRLLNIIHNCNSLVRITADLLTPLMLCALILYVSGETYSLTSTPNEIFFRNFTWQFCLIPEFLPEICWEDVAEEIFAFWCLNWGLNRGFMSNKPTHYLLEYGDFKLSEFCRQCKFKFLRDMQKKDIIQKVRLS